MADPKPESIFARNGDATGARRPRRARRTAGASATSPAPIRHHLLGVVVLLLVAVPAYVVSREAVGARGDVVEAKAATASQIDADEIRAHIAQVAARYGVSPRLVAAIIEAESSFDPHAISRRGARGLMQLMPATRSELQVHDAFDPFENIEGGVRHLRRLMDRFEGDLVLALAAYNAGARAVTAYGGVPPYRETRRYVVRILRQLGYDRATIDRSMRARGEARRTAGIRGL